MTSMVLFGIGMVALIAAIVVYLLKDDTTSKKWADQTKVVIEANESLAGEMKAAIDAFDKVCKNHASLVEELDRQKAQLEKLEFAIQKPSSGIQLPSTINFTVVERRRVVQPKPAETLNGAHPLPAKPDAATQKVIKKVKKQMKELSQ